MRTITGYIVPVFSMEITCLPGDSNKDKWHPYESFSQNRERAEAIAKELKIRGIRVGKVQQITLDIS